MPCGVIWCPLHRWLWPGEVIVNEHIISIRSEHFQSRMILESGTPKDLKMALRICFLSNAAMYATGPKPRTLTAFAENGVFDTYVSCCQCTRNPMVPAARRKEGEVAVLVKRAMFEDNRYVRKRIMPGELRIVHGGCDQKSDPQRPTSSHVSGYGPQLATRIRLVPSYQFECPLMHLFRFFSPHKI